MCAVAGGFTARGRPDALPCLVRYSVYPYDDVSLSWLPTLRWLGRGRLTCQAVPRGWGGLVAELHQADTQEVERPQFRIKLELSNLLSDLYIVAAQSSYHDPPPDLAFVEVSHDIKAVVVSSMTGQDTARQQGENEVPESRCHRR